MTPPNEEMRSNQAIPIQIFGQIYRLRGGDDPDRVREIAAMVDERMNRVADRGASADSYRIAVLAALELAGELAELQEKHDSYCKEVSSKSDRLAALLRQTEEPDAPGEELKPAAD